MTGDCHLMVIRKSAECIVPRLNRGKARSLTTMEKLDPWYIVGLVDGEGCFAVTISKH